jgi:hypothetical protein
MNLFRCWAVLLGLFGACHCATALSFARVDLGGRVGVGTCRHLDDVQFLAAMADHDTSLAVSRVDQLRQAEVELVNRWLVQGVDVHEAGKSILTEDRGPVKTFSGLGYFRTGATGEPRFTTTPKSST